MHRRRGAAAHRRSDRGGVQGRQPDADDAETVALERGRLARAPLVVAVVSRARPHVKIPEWEQVMSAGAVCMNLVIAANAMGYATSWITEWYAFDRRVLDALGLAPHERIAGFVHIGRPAEPPAERPRPALSRPRHALVSGRACSTRPIRRRHGLPHDPFKAIVAPRPIGWITAMSAQGEVNLSPYSFFNAFSDRPDMVAFSSQRPQGRPVLHRGDRRVRLQSRDLGSPRRR